MATIGASDRVSNALVEALGPEQVLVDPETKAGYLCDWTGRWEGEAAAVVRPGTAEEVHRVVRICEEFRHPLVPQGGNTGLVGGSIPHDGEVVLSLRRLNQLSAVDQGSREVTVGAGVTIGTLQEHARRSGLAYGVDLASREGGTDAAANVAG
ncbi:MAG: FAD-binding oxidoreductase, partial [Acidimicrobiia bacterium]